MAEHRPIFYIWTAEVQLDALEIRSSVGHSRHFAELFDRI